MNRDQKSRVRRLIQGGKSMGETADRVGVSYHAVWRYCKANDLEVIHARGRLPDGIRELRAALTKAGSVDVLAEEFGVTPQAVYYRLSQAKKEEQR